MAKKALAPSQVVTTRDHKGLKFMSIVEAAYNKAGLLEDEAQRINDAPGLAELVGGFIEENRCLGRYKDQEVQSSYGYLSGYTVPKPVADQVATLKGFFPGLGSFDESIATLDPPAGAEGYFAIPPWEAIAATYGEAVRKVLDLIKQTRDSKFDNFRSGRLGVRYLRQQVRTAGMIKELADRQPGHDFLIVPAQFGWRHCGRSVLRAREVMIANEFGLGAYHAGIMLLTHPERLQHYDDLWIDCAGDEYAPEASGDFRSAPFFFFSEGRVRFGTRYTDEAVGGYGSASAFLPGLRYHLH